MQQVTRSRSNFYAYLFRLRWIKPMGSASESGHLHG